MNQVPPRSRLLLIDDNANFLAQLQDQGLAEYFDPCCIPMTGPETEGTQGLAMVSAEASRAQPDDLLLDVNLRGSGDSMQLLEALRKTRALPEACRVWLISQAAPGEAHSILARFQQIDANVQDKLLLKPISPRRLWAELRDEADYDPDPQWRAFPLPLRVLSPRGKVLYANPHWTNRDLPDPDLFRWAPGDAPPPPKDFTGSYHGENKAGFTVHSYPIEQDGQTFLAQVAEVHPLEPPVTDLKQTLQRIFETMRQAGYHYGRFYRVRRLAQHRDSGEYDRVLELTDLSYAPPEGLSLPYRLPLRGEIKRRFKEYPSTPPESLAYRIRTRHDDDQARDPLVDDLNRRLGLGTLSSWLEVPVWVWRADGAQDGAVTENGGYEIAGWLFFDRRCPPQDEAAGAVDDQVTEPIVRPQIPLLRSLVRVLAATMRQKRLQDLSTYEAKMRRLDQSLIEEPDSERRFDTLLATLCDLSGAATGVLMVKDDFGANLRVAALQVPADLGFLRDLAVPLNADYHPIVKAWNDEVPYACQDFQRGPIQSELFSTVSAATPPDHIRQFDQQCQDRFGHWVKEDIRALAAIPILLPPRRKIGAITLQFDHPYSITLRRFERINTVLQRARWLLQQYHDDKERAYWQGSLGHELKTFLNIALCEIDALGADAEEAAKGVAYRQARLNVLAARDLAENWMDSHRRTAGRTEQNSTFEPRGHVAEYLDLSTYRIEEERIDLSLTPALDHEVWGRPLWGAPAKFGRVVRVLLDNAFKYGRAFLGLDSEKRVGVDLAVEVGDRLWTLRITSPGHMDEESYRLRFQPGAVSSEHRHSGAHVGLAVARHWAEFYGGSLTLENLQHSRVEARLSWPLPPNYTLSSQ